MLGEGDSHVKYCLVDTLRAISRRYPDVEMLCPQTDFNVRSGRRCRQRAE